MLRDQPRLQRVVGVGLAAAATIWSSTATSQVRLPPEAPSQKSAAAAFESAVIRENRLTRAQSGPSRATIDPAGRFQATGVMLAQLIMPAYDVRFERIVGGPAWMTRDRFDIAANAPDGYEPGHARAMLRNLLEDRFHLVARRGVKRVPVYALERVSGSKLGPGLRAPSPSCEDRTTPPGRQTQRLPEPLFGCEPASGFGPGWIFVRRAPVSALLVFLRSATGREVLDRTSLKGFYDIDVRFTPEPGAGPPFDTPATPDASGASIFTAVREQLGLTLAPATADLDVLSIERVERPTTD
jgi:uncharacterized protein (TIGR03435 family)